MISVLAIGYKVHWFKPGRGDEFLRAIKIRSTPSFGGEVKPMAPWPEFCVHFSSVPFVPHANLTFDPSI
jgi:hypothetical protein